MGGLYKEHHMPYAVSLRNGERRFTSYRVHVVDISIVRYPAAADPQQYQLVGVRVRSVAIPTQLPA